MRNSRTVAIAVPAQAQVIPGRWEKVSRRFVHLSKRRNYE